MFVIAFSLYETNDVNVPLFLLLLPISKLHYAAECGSSYRLIKLLIKMDPSAVTALDTEGKAPIHCLCLNFDATPSYLGISAEECMFRSMVALLEADASIVTFEDKLDQTALEYAITANAPFRIIRYLQKTTERYWKEHHSHQASASLQHDDKMSAHSDPEPRGDQTVTTSYPSRSNEESMPERNPQRTPPTKKPSRSKYAMTA